MAKDGFSTLEDALEAADAELRVELEFEASCDFLLACELLAPRRNSEVVREGGAHWPIRAYATCACLALELALKSRISLDGQTPKKTHRFSELFALLSRSAQDDIGSGLVLDGRPATLPQLVEALTRCDHTFDTWRYRHEHRDADFYGGCIFAMIRAVHDSILRVRPEWRGARDRLTRGDASGSWSTFTRVTQIARPAWRL